MQHRVKEGSEEKKQLIAVSLIRGIAGPGLNSSLGIFFPSVAAALGVGVGAVSWSVSVGALAGMLFLPFASLLFDRLGIRFTALIGVFLVSLSYLAHAFATHLVWWYLLAVPFGIGTVLIVNMLGPLVLETASASLGASLGVMMTIAGVAAIPPQPLLSAVISRAGAGGGYLVGGFVTLMIMLPCALTLPCATLRSSPPTAVRTTARNGERSVFAYLFFLLFVIVACNTLHQHFTVMGQARTFSPGTVSLALSLSMCGAALGGLLIGRVTHLFGGIIGGYWTLGLAALSVVLFLTGGRGILWFLLACLLHGISSAAVGITVQTLARENMSETYAHTLSYLLTAIPLATVFSTPLWGIFYDRTGSYTAALWCILVLLAFGILDLFLLSRRKCDAAV